MAVPKTITGYSTILVLVVFGENRASIQDSPAASDLFCLFNNICHDYFKWNWPPSCVS